MRGEISARDAMTATETLTLTPSEQLAALETSLEASPPPADALVAARQKCLALAQQMSYPAAIFSVPRELRIVFARVLDR